MNLRMIFFIPLFLTIITPVSSQFHYNSEYCVDSAGNYTSGSRYQENLNGLLDNLVNESSSSMFNNDTIGLGINQIYGLYMCRGDLTDPQCHDCVEAASKTVVQKCPTQNEAVAWYQECMVRYANKPIFSFEDQSYMSYSWSKSNISDSAQFGKVISETMDGIITQAAYNKSSKGYATGEAKLDEFLNVYAFGQCTPDILGSRCEKCLRAAYRNMGACCGTARTSIEMYLPSCWLRYEPTPFIGEFGTDASPPPTPPPPTSRTPSSGSRPTLDFPDFPNNNTPTGRRSPPSSGNQITISLKNYLLLMTLTVSLYMAW